MSITRGAPLKPPAIGSTGGSGWDEAAPGAVLPQASLPPSAVLGLRPFIIDGSLTMVISASSKRIWPSDLLLSLGAATVREPGEPGVMLSVWLGYRSAPVYIDADILAHERIAFSADPGRDFCIMSTDDLCSALGAQPIALRSRE